MGRHGIQVRLLRPVPFHTGVQKIQRLYSGIIPAYGSIMYRPFHRACIMSVLFYRAPQFRFTFVLGFKNKSRNERDKSSRDNKGIRI